MIGPGKEEASEIRGHVPDNHEWNGPGKKETSEIRGHVPGNRE